MSEGNGLDFGNLDDWRTDPTKARNGVAFDMGKGRALIVRRANLYDRELLALFENVDTKDGRRIQEIFAHALVVDWRGIVDATGAPVPFTPHACMSLFAYAPDLWEELQRFAMNRANFRFEKSQADADAVKSSRDGGTVHPPTANS